MITIIIATYNHANYLKNCINAVLEQGEVITRIIVINDASTDNTEEVLYSIKTKVPRLLVIKNDSNLGCVEASKIGLKHVETEFFAFAAADDILMQDWASRSLSALLGSQTASLCLSNTFLKDEETGSITCTKIPRDLINRYLSPNKFRESVIKYGVWYSSNTVLFRTKSFDQTAFKSDLGPLSDRLMISILGYRSGVVVVEEKLGCFYVRKKSMSGSVASLNLSLHLLNTFSIYLFSSKIFDIDNNKFLNKLFVSTFYIYIIEQLDYIFHQYINVILETPYKGKFNSNILFLNAALIFFKIFLTVINKSVNLILYERFKSSGLSSDEIKKLKTYESNIEYMKVKFY